MSFEAEFLKWRNDAEAVDLVEFIKSRGHKLDRSGSEFVGACPSCGGRDRFSISPRDRVFNCRGFGGGGYIDAVMHIEGCNFLTACELMTGRPGPAREKAQRKAPARVAVAPKQTADLQQELPPAPAHDTAPTQERNPAPKGNTPATVFAAGKPLEGTHAAAYLEARGMPTSPGWTFDLRYDPALPYYGHADAEADQLTNLGEFPALLAAIRDATGDLIGLHRTYLDPKLPQKLDAPGDAKRNGVKKIAGKMKGGAIWLSRPMPILVIGEGLETTRSAAMLGIGGADAAFVCAVSLGNLAGGSTGSVNHPSNPKRKIPNGEPDADKPGLVLPQDAEEIIILGDSDSDRATTFGFLLTAGRRWRSEGRKVFIALAPEGKDWNDVLRENGAE